MIIIWNISKQLQFLNTQYTIIFDVSSRCNELPYLIENKLENKITFTLTTSRGSKFWEDMVLRISKAIGFYVRRMSWLISQS